MLFAWLCTTGVARGKCISNHQASIPSMPHVTLAKDLPPHAVHAATILLALSLWGLVRPPLFHGRRSVAHCVRSHCISACGAAVYLSRWPVQRVLFGCMQAIKRLLWHVPPPMNQETHPGQLQRLLPCLARAIMWPPPSARGVGRLVEQ